MRNARNTDLWKETEFGALCTPSKAKKLEQNYDVQNAICGCVLVPASTYITQICIRGDIKRLNWKSGAHKRK
jgi:hypothetical protein